MISIKRQVVEAGTFLCLYFLGLLSWLTVIVPYTRGAEVLGIAKFDPALAQWQAYSYFVLLIVMWLRSRYGS